jgi:Lrp/AsnC family leucine-responsive transcriptional regulator
MSSVFGKFHHFRVDILRNGELDEQRAGSWLKELNILHYNRLVDSIDLSLLTALQENGRITNVELARRSDLAPSTTLERVRRLEEQGIIDGYRAILNPQALGYAVQGMVLITLDRHQAGPIDEFEERIRTVAEVKACFHLTGQYDYMLHVVVRDIDHLRELVIRKLTAIRGVEKQETLLVLSTVKEDEGYALDAGLAENHSANREG